MRSKLFLVSVVCILLIILVYFNFKKKENDIKHIINSVLLNESASESITLKLDDILICVRTTRINHKRRLEYLINTWYDFTKLNTYFITDVDDNEYSNKTGNHMLNSLCSSSHSRYDLCCKMDFELMFQLKFAKKWFCHFDDDNYVNINALQNMLAVRNWKRHHYIGKQSINNENMKKHLIHFPFATGGAGFCLSRSLVLQIFPFYRKNRFVKFCEEINSPDDVTLAYILGKFINVSLTEINGFHSHFENLHLISQNDLTNEITLSYEYQSNTNKFNVVSVRGFNIYDDPTRFYSIHCHLHPTSFACTKLKSRYTWTANS